MASMFLTGEGQISRALARDSTVDLYLEETPEIIRRLGEEMDVSKISEKVIDDALEIHKKMHRCYMVYELAVKLSDGLGMKEYALRTAEEHGLLGHGIRIARDLGMEDRSRELYDRALRSEDRHFAAYCAEEFGDVDSAVRLYEDCGSMLEAVRVAHGSGDFGKAIDLLRKGGFHSEAVNLYKETGDEKSAEALYRCARSDYTRGGRYSKAAELARDTGHKKDRLKFGLMKLFSP